MSTVGSFDDGASASGLPGVFLLGTGAFDLTNPKAYSSVSGVTIGIGGVSAAKAAGAKTFLLVLPDSPQLQFVSNQVVEAGKQLGIKVQTLFIPIDATDFAPVAAQIKERDADAVGLLPAAPVPMINALAAEGITPKNTTMSIASIVMTPQIVKQLGKALDGMIVVAPTVPPTEKDNPGIAEFRAALKANGQNPDDPNIDFNTVLSWSNLKKLEAALLAAGPSVIASLDSKSLVDAVVNHSDRPSRAGALRLPDPPTSGVPGPRLVPDLHPAGRHPQDEERQVPAPLGRVHRRAAPAVPEVARRSGARGAVDDEGGAADVRPRRSTRGRRPRRPPRPGR